MFPFLGCFCCFSIKVGVYVLKRGAIELKASTSKGVTVDWACWRRVFLATSSKGKHTSGDGWILLEHPGVALCLAWHYGGHSK